MHTKHIVVFGLIACLLAMFAYLFVFAEAPIVDNPPPPTAAAAQ